MFHVSQTHSFFKGVDFEALEARRAPTPWVPPLSGETDTSMFDEYDETEDTSCDMYSDAPSEAVWRREFESLDMDEQAQE